MLKKYIKLLKELKGKSEDVEILEILNFLLDASHRLHKRVSRIEHILERRKN